MSIHRSKHLYGSHHKLDNHILELVEEDPYLGVTIHKGHKWQSHINKISNKTTSALGFIQRNLKHANRDLRELVNASLVGSILEYSTTVWDIFYQKDIDRFERVQRRAVRFVLNDNKPLRSASIMASKLGWKPLAERRREHRLYLLCNIINGLTAIPADTHLHFNTRITQHTTYYIHRHLHCIKSEFILSKYKDLYVCYLLIIADNHPLNVNNTIKVPNPRTIH